MNIFKLPDLGEGLVDAEIVHWHVKPGDEVKTGQLLVSVETAKAIVDIPSPSSSRVIRLFGEEGEIMSIDDPLVEFESESTTDSGTVVGEVKAGSQVVKDSASEITIATGKRGLKVTPAVRALAQRLEVDLSIITPTGPHGTITANDVQRVAKILSEVGPMKPLRGARRAMARTMAQAHAEVVPVTLYDLADIEAWPEHEDITARLIQSIITGCRAEPSLNSWFDAHALGRRLLKKIHLGIAVDTSEGLFVPVIKDIAHYSADEIRVEIDRLKSALADRTIEPKELRGHTFTLSNFGTLAGRFANPIVVPPTVAILGAGHIYQDVVPENGVAVIHRMLPLSLTFDHRSVTGGEASRFLAAVVQSLSE